MKLSSVWFSNQPLLVGNYYNGIVTAQVDGAGRLLLSDVELRLVSKEQVGLGRGEPVVQEAAEDERGEEGEGGEGGEVGEAEAGVDVGGEHGGAGGSEEVKSQLDRAVDGEGGGVRQQGGQEVGGAEHGGEQTKVYHDLVTFASIYVALFDTDIHIM